jgi:hypothetical protein
MNMLTRRIGILVLATTAVVLTAGGAAAQVSPTAPPHPNMPWNPYNPTGQFIRYIQVPPQQVAIDVPAPPAPTSAPTDEEKKDGDKPAETPKPPATQQQVLEIPGYVVTETTAGYIYPERWTLQRTATGGLQWVRLPQQFQRK